MVNEVSLERFQSIRRYNSHQRKLTCNLVDEANIIMERVTLYLNELFYKFSRFFFYLIDLESWAGLHRTFPIYLASSSPCFINMRDSEVWTFYFTHKIQNLWFFAFFYYSSITRYISISFYKQSETKF